MITIITYFCHILLPSYFLSLSFNSSFRLLRAALSAATVEFDRTVKREKEMVKRLGGLYVIGTSRYRTYATYCNILYCNVVRVLL